MNYYCAACHKPTRPYDLGGNHVCLNCGGREISDRSSIHAPSVVALFSVVALVAASLVALAHIT